MVIRQNWSIWRQSSTERATKIKLLILDDSWWERVEYLLSFTEPILSMIRYTDMDRPCIGEIYDGIDSMIEKMKSTINAKEKDPEETFFKQVHAIVEERWNKMTTPLHLLAFALSPKYYSNEILSLLGRLAPYRDLEVSDGYKKAFRRLFPDPELQDIVTSEFIDFVHSNGQSIEALRDKFKKDAHSWWYYHGQYFKNLQPLAIKVLSQVASSSASERNWSTYSFIHSIKRNRLHSKKAENLVYVHSNLRLLSHKQDDYKQGETKMWDIEPEHPDLDASTSHLIQFDDSDDQDEPNTSASDSVTGCGSSNIPTPSNVNVNDDDIFADED